MRPFRFLAPVLVTLLLLAGCSAPDGTAVSYQPKYLPVEFVLDDQGNISVQGSKSLITDIGTFSVSATYELPAKNDDDLYIYIRDQKQSRDRVFLLRDAGDELTAVLDGTTTVKVKDDRIIIDITSAKVRLIKFQQGSADQKVTDGSSVFPQTPPTGQDFKKNDILGRIDVESLKLDGDTVTLVAVVSNATSGSSISVFKSVRCKTLDSTGVLLQTIDCKLQGSRLSRRMTVDSGDARRFTFDGTVDQSSTVRSLKVEFKLCQKAKFICGQDAVIVPMYLELPAPPGQQAENTPAPSTSS